MIITLAILCSVAALAIFFAKTRILMKVLESIKVLEQDKTTLHGYLDNGFTYYITENAYDHKKASLRLVVKVGSLAETEEERGLAHFVEHMVFRGTERYSDGEVIKYLESIGAAFGADTNAYTSYDETVYMFEIPLDKEESLEKAVAILSEFAMKAQFSEEQLAIEKNVVLDELRLRTGNAFGRSNQQVLENLFEGSLYAERNPIGLEEVVKGCTQEKIKQFYHKWYRPENMAVVAVGDFSKEDVKTYINKYFGRLSAPREESRALPSSYMNYVEPHLVKVYKDPEQVQTYFVLNSWIESNRYTKVKDFRKNLLNQLTLAMVNRRLSIKAKENQPPFQMGVVNNAQWVAAASGLIQYCVCWNQEPMRGLEAFLAEMQAMVQEDFTLDEFEIVMENQKKGFEIALENAHQHKNPEYAAAHLSHFLGRGFPCAFAHNAQLGLEILKTIELREVNQGKRSLLDQSKKMVMLISSADAPEVSEEEIKALLKKEYVADTSKKIVGRVKLSLTTSLAPGAIVHKELFKENGLQKWTLSNGMEVYLDKTPLKRNLFSFHFKAKGGLTSYDDKLYPSALYACPYLERSGLAGLSQVELQDALTGKHLSFDYGIGITSRDIVGETSNDDMEFAMKLVHALFTEQTYRQDAWDQTMKMADQMMQAKAFNPDIQFEEEVMYFESSNHYLFKTYDSQSASQRDAEKILQEAFKHPAEYTLVISGDYEEEKLAASLEKYVASIPTVSETFPSAQCMKIDFPEGVHERHLQYPSIGKESMIQFACPIDVTSFKDKEQDFYYFDLAQNIINTRLMKKLRSDLGETYYVSCRAFFPFGTQMNSGKFVIRLPTSLQAVDSMREALLKEIENTFQTNPTAEEIAAAEEIAKHHEAQMLHSNAGRAAKLCKQLEFGYKPEQCFLLEKEEVAAERLHEAMQSLLNRSQYSLHTKRQSS